MAISDALDALIERASKLRNAGVRVVQIDGFRVELDPQPTYAIGNVNDESEPEPSDPLDDPATFGRKSGTPGFDLSDAIDRLDPEFPE